MYFDVARRSLGEMWGSSDTLMLWKFFGWAGRRPTYLNVLSIPSKYLLNFSLYYGKNNNKDSPLTNAINLSYPQLNF